MGWVSHGIPSNRQLVPAVGCLCGHPEGPHQALLQQQMLRCCSFSVKSCISVQLENISKWSLPECRSRTGDLQLWLRLKIPIDQWGGGGKVRLFVSSVNC